MNEESNNPIDSPTAWFCVLEVARRRGDVAAAERAERELRRLGVRVDWPPTQRDATSAAGGRR